MVGVSPPQRDARIQHPHGPLVPLARAGFAVGLPRALQTAARFFVRPADQRDLRQGIEHGAGGLPHELLRAAHVECTVKGFLGARQIPDADADLSE